ncbi:MAG: hypothetical protein IPM82_16760 [Saprospiraceae bacterium]|nr:hypothetical protein [Saprospiraceae bacterium]
MKNCVRVPVHGEQYRLERRNAAQLGAALKKDGGLIPVPYDFDFSAIVVAPYARLNTDVGQKRIGDRVFMGNAASAEGTLTLPSATSAQKGGINWNRK